MRIEGVTISFARSDGGGRPGVPFDERRVREVCARALRKAEASKAGSISLQVSGCAKGDPSLTPYAKIMAQEVLRYVRRPRRSLGSIRFVLQRPADLPKFRSVVEGYLGHVLRTLSQGPYVTVDTVIEVGGGIVLVKRSNPPFGWALPGGFLDYGESLEEAAAREAREETGLRVKNLKQLHTYSDPSRDPRFHTVTTVFVCQAQGVPKAGSDAADARIFKKRAWRDVALAFDHKKILEDYRRER